LADLSQVEQALVNLISQIVYPSGTGQPSAIVVGGSPVAARVYRGWPNRQALDIDVKSASGTVTIGGTSFVALDTVALTFSSSGVAGFPVTITYTLGAGESASSIALGMNNLINSNMILSGSGLSSQVIGAVIYIAQSPPSGTGTVMTDTITGTGNETVTFSPASGGLTTTLNISVFAMNIERNVTRYPRTWYELPVVDTAVTVTVDQALGTVTIAGTLPSPFAATNFAVVTNNLEVFTYSLQSGDTFTDIATALATSIATDFPGTSNTGAVVTVVGSNQLAASVGIVSGILREVKRQKRHIRISMWCPDPFSRDAAGSLLDPALAAPIWVTMPDGTAAWVRGSSAPAPDDDPQKELLYRRDLVYEVEYSTSQIQQADQINAISATFTVDISGTSVTTSVA
jgi:hypothetical protein